MYNGFDLPKNILDEHLNFIREEKDRITAQLNKLDNLKGYEKSSDDAGTLKKGYQKLLTELNYLLKHDYDAENITL